MMLLDKLSKFRTIMKRVIILYAMEVLLHYVMNKSLCKSTLPLNICSMQCQGLKYFIKSLHTARVQLEAL